MTTFQRVCRWLIFSVLIGLSPLLASYLFSLIKGNDPTLTNIIGAGELFLVIIALCGAAIGDLVSSGQASIKLKLISGGMTLIVFLLSALIFAGVSEARISGSSLESDVIAATSSILFLIGVVSCGCCVAASEV